MHNHEHCDEEYALEQGHSHSHEHSHGQEHGHRHVHTEEENKVILNRISRAIGHLESIKRMINDGRDCSEVLIQLAAVRSAINNTGKIVLQNHIESCIVEAVKLNDMAQLEELKEAIDRFIK